MCCSDSDLGSGLAADGEGDIIARRVLFSRIGCGNESSQPGRIGGARVHQDFARHPVTGSRS